jgi:pimeloyl-ACP methyl ester carboxylesterase
VQVLPILCQYVFEAVTDPELALACAEYGSPTGRLVVYFHGAPGAMEESSLFDGHARIHNLRIICFDRFAIDKSHDRESYYRLLARSIEAKADGRPVAIIGFSIGAHVALEVSARLNVQVPETHLVSAAAPIATGDFHDSMAGGEVFRLAAERPGLFSVLTKIQGILALLAPRLLFRMLFSSATGEDKELSKRYEFRCFITPLMRHCFVNRASGYIRDIRYYVTWPGNLAGNQPRVSLWHGTDDNWAPFSMASYLCNAMPGASHVEAMKGMSHYSCLYAAVPKICSQLGHAASPR